MRNIPIGTIDIRPVNNGSQWEILDGQQRTNAIAMGYADFPNKKSEEKAKICSILWLDLGAVSEKIEQSDGKNQKSERKFFFRVTTPAHPWGYALSDNDTRNKPLSYSKQKEALKSIAEKWEKYKSKGAKPFTYEMYPFDAILPVPFTLLRQFFEKNENGSFEDFKANSKYQDYNWFIAIKDKTVPLGIWEKIKNAMNVLNDKVILGQNSKSVADDDVGLYFKRMNKSGVVPDEEEIQYSLLKAKLPQLKKNR